MNKYLLCHLVYIETGITVYDVPDGCVFDVFMFLSDAMAGSHRITACVAFLGVWA